MDRSRDPVEGGSKRCTRAPRWVCRSGHRSSHSAGSRCWSPHSPSRLGCQAPHCSRRSPHRTNGCHRCPRSRRARHSSNGFLHCPRKKPLRLPFRRQRRHARTTNAARRRSSARRRAHNAADLTQRVDGQSLRERRGPLVAAKAEGAGRQGEQESHKCLTKHAHDSALVPVRLAIVERDHEARGLECTAPARRRGRPLPSRRAAINSSNFNLAPEHAPILTCAGTASNMSDLRVKRLLRCELKSFQPYANGPKSLRCSGTGGPGSGTICANATSRWCRTRR